MSETYLNEMRCVSLSDLDEYLLRYIADILHLQGISRHIGSRFSVDEWRDIRALRATCQDFARTIGAPRVLSKSAQICRDQAHLSGALWYIFREHFSAHSIELMQSALCDRADLPNFIEFGARINRAMCKYAASGCTTWRAAVDAISREFGNMYITRDIAPVDRYGLDYDIYRVFDNATILLDHRGLQRPIALILHKIITNYLVQLMLAYGVKDDEYAQICDLLQTSDPTSVRAIIYAHPGAEHEVVFERRWQIRNFRAILETDRETMRDRCATLFAQFPRICAIYHRVPEIDVVDLFMRDNPIQDLIIRHCRDMFSKEIMYTAIISPFVSCDDIRSCARLLYSLGDDYFTQSASMLRAIYAVPRTVRDIIAEDGAPYRYVSIARESEACKAYLTDLQSLEMIRILGGRRVVSVKSLCALYLKNNCSVARMFEQFPDRTEFDIIVTFAELKRKKIASYGIDAGEMLRKFYVFRAHY